MRGRKLAAACAVVCLLVSGTALADHFDGDAGTGTFNPILTYTLGASVVDRPGNLTVLLTQADHEDPSVVSQFRIPGDTQYPFASVRPGENTSGVATSNCKDTMDNVGNSPNGTGTGTNVDYSKRTDAKIVRAEKLGTIHIAVHADGVSRPGSPVVWDGDIAFLKWDAVTQSATLCLLLITHDSRVTSLPDPNPGNTKDDIEQVTEIITDFAVSKITDGGNSWWEIVADLSSLAKDSTFQTLNVSLLELRAVLFAHSAGNWQTGGVDAQLAPHISGVRSYAGIFTTCPPNDPAYGNCKSTRGPITRTSTFTITLPTPAMTAPTATLTNVNPVTVSGTADPGAVVRVFDSGVPAVDAPPADASGHWTVGASLPDGAHTLSARTVDAGGQSALSNTKSFTLDTSPPAKPGIASPVVAALVGGTQVQVTGSAEPGSTVRLYDGGIGVAQATSPANGSYTIGASLAKGPHTITVDASDAAGNVSLSSDPVPFDVTTAAPIFVNPPQGSATKATSVAVGGTVESGSAVTLYDAGSLIGSTVASGTTWSIPIAFAEGSHTLTAFATAPDSFVSPESPVRSFDVDFTPPGAPSIGVPSSGDTVHSSSVRISGTSEALASVAVYEGTKLIARGGATAAGEWSVTGLLFNGSHSIKAIATDRAGNIGPASAVTDFIVDDPLKILTPAAGALVPGAVAVSGDADVSSSEVRLYEGFTKLGSAPVVDGHWSAEVPMESGAHTIVARAVTNGVLSPPTQSRSFTVDATPPTVWINQPSGTVARIGIIGPGEHLRGVASDPQSFDSRVDRIQITYKNFFTGSVAVQRDAACDGCPGPSVTWSDVTPAPGLYSVEAVAFDRVGNASATDKLSLLIL